MQNRFYGEHSTEQKGALTYCDRVKRLAQHFMCLTNYLQTEVLSNILCADYEAYLYLHTSVWDISLFGAKVHWPKHPPHATWSGTLCRYLSSEFLNVTTAWPIMYLIVAGSIKNSFGPGNLQLFPLINFFYNWHGMGKHTLLLFFRERANKKWEKRT